MNLFLHTESTAQRDLWLYHRAVVKGMQIVSPSFILYTQSSTHAQYRNLTPAVVQIAYTFTVILCQEWDRAITRKYQSTLC